MTTGTLNLYAFSTAVVKHFIIAVAFGFGYEIYVLDVGAFFEHYRPVGVVVSSRSVNVETAGQLGIDYDFILMFKCLGKVHFDALRIYHYEVVKRFLRFHGVDTQFAF